MTHITTAVVVSLFKRFCMLPRKNGTERPNKMSKMFEPAVPKMSASTSKDVTKDGARATVAVSVTSLVRSWMRTESVGNSHVTLAQFGDDHGLQSVLQQCAFHAAFCGTLPGI